MKRKITKTFSLFITFLILLTSIDLPVYASEADYETPVSVSGGDISSSDASYDNFGEDNQAEAVTGKGNYCGSIIRIFTTAGHINAD